MRNLADSSNAEIPETVNDKTYKQQQQKNISTFKETN